MKIITSEQTALHCSVGKGLRLFLSSFLALGLLVTSNGHLAADAADPTSSLARSLYSTFQGMQVQLHQAKKFLALQNPDPILPDSRLISLELKFKPSNAAGSPKNFSEAKRVARQIYKFHQLTFYCGKSF